MAKGKITNAAGDTDGFFYDMGRMHEASKSDTELVLSARILSGPLRGEQATILLIGTFDFDRGTARIAAFEQWVDGKLHFSLEPRRPLPLDAFWTDEIRQSLTIDGNRFDNLLPGDTRNDRLYGHGGADRLVGLGGADLLEGGTGADRFVYTSIRESTLDRTDTILDFGRGDDVINLKAIDADVGAAGGQAFDFIGADRFSGTAGELRIGGGGWLVLGDTDGDGAADLAIRLSGAPPVDAGDFIL